MSTVVVLSSLFARWAGAPAERVAALPGAGSNRQYYRLSGGGKRAVGTFGSDPRENRAFLALAACLRSNGVAAPEIYAAAPDGLHYLQEDLGNLSLFDALYTPAAPRLLQQAMEQLAHIQVNGARGFDWSNACPTAVFDERTVRFDLNYFKYNFLKLMNADFDEWRLEDDFDRLTAALLRGAAPDCCMYRDFQSRNIMVDGDTLRFIDFQGARRGPVAYDAASFLFQARAHFSDAQRDALWAHYLASLSALMPVNRDALTAQLYMFALFRGLQTLGAYGFRGLFERKALFLQSIPAALSNLQRLIRSGRLSMGTPYLFQLIDGLRLPDAGFPDRNPTRLTVTVHSFAFRNGYPADFSGNGGGFVFDCRGLVNPGTAATLADLTGRDRPVADYLAQQPDVDALLRHAFAILDRSVARYTARGFTDLSVAFGCTGGRHRSVYCAERTAAHLAARREVDVRLIHHEQHVTQFIPAS
jgi:aminoglycoside/choline kinase family phosphotransferase